MSSVDKSHSETKASNSRETKIYETQSATKQANGEQTEFTYAMCDEIHIREGVKYHTLTGATLGLKNNMLDVVTVLHRLLSEDKRKVEKAKKANQWLIICFGTKKFQSWVAEFFLQQWFADGRNSPQSVLQGFHEL